MLDHETLLLVQVSFTLLTTVLLVSAALYSDSPLEQRYWATGNITSCLGLALGALTALPLWLHGMLSYGIMALGLAVVLKGLRMFYRRDLSWRWVAGITLAGTVLPGYYALVLPDLSMRLVVTGFFFAALNWACAITLLRHSRGRAVLPCVVGFAALGLALALRGAYLVASPNPTEAMDQLAMTVSLFVIPLAQVCILFGLILMVARRYAERLQQLSMLDSLTGALNRRAFESQAQRILQRAAQAGASVAVVMLDADHFKQINDSHGHQMGDEVLRQMCALLTRQLRPVDLLARYGGEEFVLVLDGLEVDQAATVADRLRLLLAQQLVEDEGRRLNYTVSMGVACTGQHGYTLADLVAAGDAALYAAKKAGRNRVQQAPPGSAEPRAAALALPVTS